MTALRLSYSFLNTNSLTSLEPSRRYSRRASLTIFCQTEKGTLASSSNQPKKDNENDKQIEPPSISFLKSVMKLGDELKESLSPKQKGDWKDVVLMSLSFAVYVYMSEKIVCAYCAWTSMAKHSW